MAMTKSWQELAGVGRSWQELAIVGNSWQELAMDANGSWRKLDDFEKYI